MPVLAAGLVELGRLDQPARPIPGDGPRGRLYYLPGSVRAHQDGAVAARGNHAPASRGDGGHVGDHRATWFVEVPRRHIGGHQNR